MHLPIKIAPSILAADFARLGDQIQEAEASGAELIHIDVMDGQFVPNISFGAMVVKVARRVTQLPLDVHLMVMQPEKHLQAFVEAGANAITVHYEACPHLHRVLQQIHELGVHAGVALNPHTPAILLSDILNMLDNVLVMTVNPGAGGQAFIYDVVPKIQALRRMITLSKRQIDITVDGGIDASTIGHAMRGGANVMVAGTAVFGAKGGIPAGMQLLRSAIEREQEK